MIGSQQPNASGTQKIVVGSESLPEPMRAAVPRLIVRAVPDPSNELCFKVSPYISEVEDREAWTAKRCMDTRVA
jgi:hypothetical protein